MSETPTGSVFGNCFVSNFNLCQRILCISNVFSYDIMAAIELFLIVRVSTENCQSERFWLEFLADIK